MVKTKEKIIGTHYVKRLGDLPIVQIGSGISAEYSLRLTEAQLREITGGEKGLKKAQ